jgi:hypothetical protein
MAWVQKFDNTYWTAMIGSWDAVNSEWDSSGDSLVLEVVGTWANNYNPSKVRITFTSTITELDTAGYNASGGYIWTESISAGTPTEINLTPPLTADIHYLDVFDISGLNTFIVTNIEFEETGSSSSSSSSISSSSSSSTSSTIICPPGVHGLKKVDWRNSVSEEFNKVVSDKDFCELLNYVADAAFPYIKDSGLIITQIGISPSGSEADDKYEAIWIPSGSNYYADVRHYMGTKYPYASALWDETTNEVIYPIEIEFLTTKELRVWSLYSKDMTLVVASRGNKG